jgi:hypothetical protein
MRLDDRDDTTTNNGGEEGDGPSPQSSVYQPLPLDWGDKYCHSLLENRGRVSLALMPPNEAKAFQSLSRPNGHTHVRAIDTFWCIVIYSRTQTNINALDEILNLTGGRPKRYRAPRIETPGRSAAPGSEPINETPAQSAALDRQPTTETSGRDAAVDPQPTTQITVSFPVLFLLVAVAVLGGLFADTVLSIGPIRKSLN